MDEHTSNFNTMGGQGRGGWKIPDQPGQFRKSLSQNKK